MIARLRLAAVALSLALLSLALLPVQLAALSGRGRLARRVPRLWHRAACRLIGLRVHVRGRPIAQGPVLIAANHSSWADIPALGSLAELSFVAKAEVRDWPLFGWLARLQRCVFVDRGDRSGAGRQADALGRRLSAGETVVLFAEGTTSDGNEVLAFNSSLFGAAEASLRAGTLSHVTVQPVSVAYLAANGMALGRYGRPLAAWTGDLDLLPHLARFVREGAVDVEVSFGEPVVFTPALRRKTVAREAESRVRTLHAASLARGPDGLEELSRLRAQETAACAGPPPA